MPGKGGKGKKKQARKQSIGKSQSTNPSTPNKEHFKSEATHDVETSPPATSDSHSQMGANQTQSVLAEAYKELTAVTDNDPPKTDEKLASPVFSGRVAFLKEQMIEQTETTESCMCTPTTKDKTIKEADSKMEGSFTVISSMGESVNLEVEEDKILNEALKQLVGKATGYKDCLDRTENDDMMTEKESDELTFNKGLHSFSSPAFKNWEWKNSPDMMDSTVSSPGSVQGKSADWMTESKEKESAEVSLNKGFGIPSFSSPAFVVPKIWEWEDSPHEMDSTVSTPGSVQGKSAKRQRGVSETPPSKRQKTSSDQEGSKVQKSVERLVKDFKSIHLLNQNAQEKSIVFRGCYDDMPGDAILTLERTPFTLDSVKEICCEAARVEPILGNTIYKTMMIYPPPTACNAIKSSLIYPATKSHLKKYKIPSRVMIYESATDYQRRTLPQNVGFNLQWVYNILAKEAESEKIIYEDPDPTSGFILLPDIKWNGADVSNLYLIAIVHDRSLHSIRDLTAQHLGLLENVRDSGTAAITTRYGVGKDRLRVFFHYLPSYYHLHIHFAHVDNDTPGISIGKAHFLQDVIDNIRMDSEYYQKKTLMLCVSEKHQIHSRKQRDKKKQN